MIIRSANEIYTIIERVLRKAASPMTCTEMMDIPEVREAALEEFGDDVQVATNKLSDTLGFMWRRDVLHRHPAARGNDRARYAYSWRDRTSVAPVTTPLSPPPSKKNKPIFTITESDHDVTIEFEHVTLVVKRK